MNQSREVACSAGRAHQGPPWPEQMRALLGLMVDALRAHPSTAILLATRSVASEGSLRTTEAALDILRCGFSPAEATRVVRHAQSVVTNLVGGVPGTVSREELGKLLDARRRAGLPGVAAARGLPAAGGGRGALERAGRPGRPLRLGTRSAPRRHRGDGGARTVKPRSFAEQREHTFHRSIISYQTSKQVRVFSEWPPLCLCPLNWCSNKPGVFASSAGVLRLLSKNTSRE
jgi:hypothetical protein